MSSIPPGFIVAGVRSQSGKTTVTLALMAALRRLGVAVAPFKAGPDYIDPAWHRAVCGVPSWNLDTFMVGRTACQTLFYAQRQGRLGIVEGVMGLFDGKSGIGGAGSTADLAAVLGIPVILVVEARGMAGSLAPLVAGFSAAARDFRLAGVIANGVGSEHHARLLADILEGAALPPLLGWLPRDPDLALTERHLGLVLPADQAVPDPEHPARLATALHVDPDRLLAAVSRATPSRTWEQASVALPPDTGQKGLVGSTRAGAVTPLLDGRVVAVARDRAFCFLYEANLAWLTAMGARTCFFSPLAGEPLPVGTTAVWLPGGYPELHGAALSSSTTWEELRRFVLAGGPVLAECGGMMVLGHSLIDLEGRRWPMADILPLATRMTGRLAGLGYRQEKSGARGHEFHHSIRQDDATPKPAFDLEKGDTGVRWHNLRAAYVHWYFPSAPERVAAWFSLGRGLAKMGSRGLATGQVQDGVLAGFGTEPQ
ncbi:MAG: cobyrinate a,c-diamide synthase [Magnetococcales bacterium]|nr:cobyrinate a,c-diamide synthase [Magnetococcales bacterium]